MSLLRSIEGNLPRIEEKIGYRFARPQLLILALTHRSFLNENRYLVEGNNERLEFLGDAVLGLITSDFLYHRLPSHPEGELSQIRSRLVDATACALFLQKLDLTDSILLGKGERLCEGKARMSIQADVFEALVGAIYLDGGLSVAKAFVLRHFEIDIEETIGKPSLNYKAELQDFVQRRYQQTPHYKVVKEMGPDHAKTFHVMVSINEKEYGIGVGASKRQAEQQAAFVALAKIRDSRGL
jgi:ribonuclease-3